MDDNKVSVTLAAPAKIGGKVLSAGVTVTVSAGVAKQLGEPFDTSDTPLAVDFDTEVEEVAKVLADQRIKDAVETAVATIASENEKLVAENDHLRKSLTDANNAVATISSENEKLVIEVDRLGKALEDAKAEVAAATDNQKDAAGTITDLRNRVTELETALADATKPATEGDPAPAAGKATK
ncbi:regulator of replication initiation timing [Rhizobium aquaticum]|uniref:Regulator of replication initiation timing n=1 Tax=Rhizobium aquaticum TaxID=1549636 RepID=A0ABV2ITE1_9HYPH